jgi:hypothetical protein
VGNKDENNIFKNIFIIFISPIILTIVIYTLVASGWYW